MYQYINFVSAVEETALGRVTTDTKRFLRQCQGTFAEPETVLFSTNLEVDTYNITKLNDMPGNLKTFTAKDDGDENLLKKMVTPKVD